MRKNLYFHSFHVKAESPIALKVEDNIHFFTLFLILYSMLRHKLRNPKIAVLNYVVNIVISMKQAI